MPIKTTTCARRPPPGLRAEPGDTLFIDAPNAAAVPRTGIILAVAGPGGTPPFLVRWTTGDYISHVSPGPGAHITASSAGIFSDPVDPRARVRESA